MPNNIFKYKPVLQYVLEDINSIDNLPDSNLEVVRPYIRSSSSQTIDRLNDIKSLLDTVKRNIEKRLQDVSVPFSKDLIDDQIKARIAGLSGSQSLINDGIITFDLYKQVIDDPAAQLIVDGWDEYHAGINGVLEAELYPYVSNVQDTLDGVDSVIKDTILYVLDPASISDTVKINEGELLQVEQYLYLIDSITKEAKSGTEPVSIKKQFELLESRLEYRRDAVSTLQQFTSDIGNITQDIYDGTLTEFQTVQNDILRSQITELRSNMNIGDLALRTIVHSAFNNQYEKVINTKRSHGNVLSKPIKRSVFAETTKDVRLYLDVALPIIVEAAHMDSATPMSGSGQILVDGLEELSKRYGQSLVSMKNVLQADTYVTSSLISDIYNKGRTRMMYSLIGK